MVKRLLVTAFVLTLVASFAVAAGGAVTSASGTCFTTDGEGDGSSFWWRMDEIGTETCSTMCGSWGYFDGYGKYRGLSGSGTWVQTTVFADGSIGTWEGSFSIP